MDAWRLKKKTGKRGRGGGGRGGGNGGGGRVTVHGVEEGFLGDNVRALRFPQSDKVIA